MDSILQSIEDWVRELLVSGIMSNLTNIFDSVNAQVGQIATEMGQTHANFSPAVYNMIRTLFENVIMPIAGLILTFIACYELIQLVIPEEVVDFIEASYEYYIEKGDALAANNLGALYYSGRISGEPEYEKAKEYYEVADRLGYTLASENLGYIFYYGL